MNRRQIFEKLGTLNFDKEQFYVLSGASLVAQEIILETEDIDLSCSKELYDSLDWPTKIGAFGKEIKFFDCFEISHCLFENKDKTIKINGYNFADLNNVLEIKLELNREKDVKIIEKLQKIVKN